MARRRGVPLDDPESVERRRWHLELQNMVFQSPEAKNQGIGKQQSSKKNDRKEISDMDILPPNTAASKSPSAPCKIPVLNSVPSPICRLLCIYGFGASSQLYHSWADYFESWNIELLAFEFPGRGCRIREPSLASVPDLVADAFTGVVEALQKAAIMRDISNTADEHKSPHGSEEIPLIIWGHGLGAFIAFRLGQLLSKEHVVDISHLIVSHCRAPQIQTAFNGSEHTVKLYTSSDRDLRERMLSFGILPAHMNERSDMLRTYYPLFRADYKAFETFEFNEPIPDEVDEPKAEQRKTSVRANYGWEEDENDLQWKQPDVVIPYPLHCPISAFCAMGDERVRPDHVKEWGRLSRGKNKFFLLQNGGYYFFKQLDNEMSVKEKIKNICCGIPDSGPKDNKDEDNNSVEEYIIDRS